MRRDSYEWFNAEGIVVKKQLAVAIEQRANGEIFLIQEGYSESEDDVVIILDADAAIAVANRLLELAKRPTPAKAPKDPTAADRQRRHRDKHRDVTGPVTLSGRDTGQPPSLQ